MSRKLKAELETGEFQTPLKQIHRDAMLDLVLAWGTLDGALTMLVSGIANEPLQETVDRVGKNKGSSKLLEIARILEGRDDCREYARKFKKLKKRYEKYSDARNRIAHSHCIGYLASDEQYAVFAVAEREGEYNLVVEAIPISLMREAKEYGENLSAFAIETCCRIKEAGQHDSVSE